ncbi:Virulence protein [Roseivivax sp. THAF40]|uniref:VOC family protein n=1 Tax=unclassified Roseivivax TaxID=2639302 RepID=UPI0012686E5C|nr:MULTISPECIES: VOC family protein [unclassified Roseivivax]QFS81957.1 Virulence protein [Roseivivax sp. THAF197b]QFT45757.1 Virulence protein [Roseivivax sp. THAF40]
MLRAIDHIVLTTRDAEACIAFYTTLGCRLEQFGDGRRALHFGSQKINIHIAGQEIVPHAATPAPGALDLCFLADSPLNDVMARLKQAGLTWFEGPVPRTGATGPIRSIYLRDPDGNLIEISEPAT